MNWWWAENPEAVDIGIGNLDSVVERAYLSHRK